MKRFVSITVLALIGSMGLTAPPATAEPASWAEPPIRTNQLSPLDNAPTLYVDDTGTNDEACGTSSAPCQTITYAIGKAAPGSTIDVAAGIYAENLIRIPKAATISGPNAAVPGGNPRQPEAIVKAAMLPDVDGITITGLTIDGSGVDQTPNLQKRGILIANTSKVANTTITNNIIEDWVTGISLAGGATLGWVDNTIISGNKLVNNSIGSTDNATDTTVTNNTFVNGGVGLGIAATLAAPITGNSFSGLASGRYVSAAPNALWPGQDIEAVLAENTFDKAAAVSTATGSWYTQAIFSTISSAITAAVPGATIRVAPGVYQEQVTITKPVSLLGPFDDTSPWVYGNDSLAWGDDTTQRAIIRSVVGTDSSAGIVEFSAPQAEAVNSRVAGFEITKGTGPGIPDRSGFRATQVSDLLNVTIENNYVHDTGKQGVEFGLNVGYFHDGVAIRGNLMAHAPAGDNTGIQAWTVRNLTVQGNRITGFARGMQYNEQSNTWGGDGSAWASSITGNVVDARYLGIQIANYVFGSVTIQGNDITSNSEFSGSAGIRFHPTLTLDDSVIVENNDITVKLGDPSTSSILFQQPGTNRALPVDKVTLDMNSFTDDTSITIAGRAAQQAAILDAENNYWGADGTTAAAINASIYRADVNANKIAVDFNPWIIDFTNDPAKANQPGFWPIIQRAGVETPAGTNVEDTFAGLPNGGEVTLVFDEVTTTGTTAVAAFQGDDATPFPTAPSGFTLGNPPVYYTITSETVRPADSAIRICLAFPVGSFAPDATPTMYHFTGGAWVALQTTVTGTTACASVTSFSPFALGVPLAPPPPVTVPPSAPLNVTGAAGDAQVSVSWQPPANPGSFPVTNYQAEAQPGGATCLVEAPALTCTITGLVNGQPYTVRARALNGAGWGAWSSPSNPVTPGPSTPGAPTNVAAVAGDAEATLSWAAPAEQGSSLITGYRIEQSQAEGPWEVAIADTGSTATLATVTGLVNGQPYRFRVSAINAAGVGTASAPSATVTPEEPEEPSILITGTRIAVGGKSAIRVRGETTGFAPGEIVRIWIRRPGRGFVEQRAEIVINARGNFSWRKRIAPRVAVYVQAADGTRSNRVVIPAAAG